jgi:hypothetical protein
VVFQSDRDTIYIGWSKCHKDLDQFDYVLGTEIAVRRACGAFTQHIRILSGEIPDDLIYPLKTFIERLERRFPGKLFQVGGMFVGRNFPSNKMAEIDQFLAEKRGDIWGGNPHIQKRNGGTRNEMPVDNE